MLSDDASDEALAEERLERPAWPGNAMKGRAIHGAAAGLTATAGLLVALGGAVAAGPGEAPTASSPPTTVAGAPVFDPVDLLRRVFTDDPDAGNPTAVTAMVVPGSPAAAFIAYASGFGAARHDGRQGPWGPYTVMASGSDVDVCSNGSCDTFGGFEVDDGRLRSFSINDISIDGRVAAPSKVASFGGVGVRLAGAFERVTFDQLAVVFVLETSDDEIAVEWADVVYVQPSGESVATELADSAFPATVPATGMQPVVMQFPGAMLGGEVVLAYTSPSAPQGIEVRLPVPRL